MERSAAQTRPRRRGVGYKKYKRGESDKECTPPWKSPFRAVVQTDHMGKAADDLCHVAQFATAALNQEGLLKPKRLTRRLAVKHSNSARRVEDVRNMQR